MSDLLEGVDQRTLLAGQNRLELLLFCLNGRQRFAINVFKVQEVMHCPELTHVPGSAAFVAGIATVRGKTIAAIDLNLALNNGPSDPRNSFLIVSEYNCAVQGFLVDDVDRIVNMNWKDVLPPPDGLGRDGYLTAVTRVDGDIVGMIDVEKILSEIEDVDTRVSGELTERCLSGDARTVMIVDDSVAVRHRVQKTFEQVSVNSIMADNGQEALDRLKHWAEHEPETLAALSMVIADIEMPMMDGYTLTSEIKADPRLRHLYVILHSSLSGEFNQAMVQKVGADGFVPKFDSDELVAAFMDRVGMKAERAEVSS